MSLWTFVHFPGLQSSHKKKSMKEKNSRKSKDVASPLMSAVLCGVTREEQRAAQS